MTGNNSRKPHNDSELHPLLSDAALQDRAFFRINPSGEEEQIQSTPGSQK
jgi:hypothetical protein